MNERDLHRAIVAYAELVRWRVYHVANVQKQLRNHTAVGFPDLVMVRRGRLIFAELKSERGKTTHAQDTWQLALEAVREDAPNIEVYLWRPADWTSRRIEAVLR